MKTPYFAVAIVVVALSLAPASFPCQAGSVTYAFTEGTGAPNPGEIGATITLSSPPASPSSPWSTSDTSDILALQVNDPALFPSGLTGSLLDLDLSIFGALTSPTGDSIQSGGIEFNLVASDMEINPTVTYFGYALAIYNSVPGTWVVSASVPEPASAVQAGIACTIGLALAAFRKRKEARRQQPVGPLDANQ